MCYESYDRYKTIIWGNLTVLDNETENEHKQLVERMKSRINLDLLKKLDTDNLIDYSKYE